MAKQRKTWQEKLADDKGLPRVYPVDETKSSRWGSGQCVIPAPREVDALMGKVAEGEITTIDEIRKVLARKHHATFACPLTTGIFAWIAAHAAEEAHAQGATKTTPYWRTLKAKGELNPKYPGGIDGLKSHLQSEGHSIVQKGKRYYVENFEQHLAALGHNRKGSKAEPPL